MGAKSQRKGRAAELELSRILQGYQCGNSSVSENIHIPKYLYSYIPFLLPSLLPKLGVKSKSVT